MCPFGLFQKKDDPRDPLTQLTEQMAYYKSLYTPITTDVKDDAEKERLEGSSSQFVPTGKKASHQGTYFVTNSIVGKNAGWNAKWAPLIVHNKATHSLAVGAELQRVIDSQPFDQERLYVVDQNRNRIDLFGLKYSYEEISLHVQKHEFCRELKSFLDTVKMIENRTIPSPSELKEQLDKLKKYSHALDGNFSKTKNIVNQLKEQAKKAHPDDHALDEPTLGDKIKQALSRKK